jgi:glutamine synthetase
MRPDTTDSMNKKSRQVLQRYLTKLDAGKVDGEFITETEFEFRYSIPL